MNGYQLTGHWEKRGEAWVLTLVGHLNDQTETIYDAEVASKIPDGGRVVIDAAGLAHVSSIGYSRWLQLAAHLREAGGDLVVAAAPVAVSRPLRLVFGEHIALRATVEDALGALAGMP